MSKAGGLCSYAIEGMTNNLNSIDTFKTLLYSALFAALTSAGALIRIPIPPVPITLQTLFVFLAGGLFGARVGILSQVVYLCVGFLGLPVFSGGGGIGYLLQPQAGYLLGMPAAAYIIGRLSRRIRTRTDNLKRSKRYIFLHYSMIYSVGSLVIYLFGIAYLSFYAAIIVGYEFDIIDIIWIGCIIFIPTDLVKIIIASYISVRMNRLNLFD
ncbi:biotin transporter BioY [candidate division KSB1 bacterium]